MPVPLRFRYVAGLSSGQAGGPEAARWANSSGRVASSVGQPEAGGTTSIIVSRIRFIPSFA